MTGTEKMDEIKTMMEKGLRVYYKGKVYEILGVNELNNTVTIANGPIGKDVKASELDKPKGLLQYIPSTFRRF